MKGRDSSMKMQYETVLADIFAHFLLSTFHTRIPQLPVRET
jgi:hypothetical protein